MDITSIDWKQLTINKKGAAKFVNISLNRKPVKIKLPVSRLPFGCTFSNFYGPPNYNADISLADGDLLQKLLDLDEEIISRAETEGWLNTGETGDASIVEARSKYISPVKFCKGGSNAFPPTLKIKVKVNTDADGLEIPEIRVLSLEKPNGTDESESIKLSDGREAYDVTIETYQDLQTFVPKGTSASVAVELLGVWFFNNTFGYSLRAKQILLSAQTNGQAEPEDDDFLESGEESEIDFLD